MGEERGLSRRQFGAGMAAAAAAASLGSAASSRASAKGAAHHGRRPDVLFIIADDVGHGDLGCFGHPEIATPHLDKRAKAGVKLDRAYSAGSVCSPTRVGWATGRYPGRLPAGLPEPIEAQHQAKVGLEASEPTLPRYLGDAGYRTALFGKWHLGYPSVPGNEHPDDSPVVSGFDEYWGVLDGGCDYFTHNAFAPNPGDYRLYRGTPETDAPGHVEPTDEPGYMTDLVGDRAVDVIGRQSGSSRSTSACTSALLVQLARTGTKNGLGEGGIRVPGIIRWPGRIKPGSTSDQVLTTMDLTASVLAVAGVTPPKPLDGRDVIGILAGKETAGPAQALLAPPGLHRDAPGAQRGGPRRRPEVPAHPRGRRVALRRRGRPAGGGQPGEAAPRRPRAAARGLGGVEPRAPALPAVGGAAGMRRPPGGTFAMGCDVAYPEEAPARQVSVDPSVLVPGSFVFLPPPHPVSLRDHGAWWSFVPGACWRAPFGPGSDLGASTATPSCTSPTRTPRRARPGPARRSPPRPSGSTPPAAGWTARCSPGATSTSPAARSRRRSGAGTSGTSTTARGRGAHRAGRQLRAQRLRPARHGGQRVGVDLVEPPDARARWRGASRRAARTSARRATACATGPPHGSRSRSTRPRRTSASAAWRAEP
jgi:hypothetical protein